MNVLKSIEPLSEEVVSNIKSATTITSLEGVVLGLLKNSLDSNATNIQVTVDFQRGSCVVEDNGAGIEPKEFAESGGLAKLYHTSRTLSGDDTHGTCGMFLASLGALSLLTITSRHHLHRSHNTLIIHRSKPIARLRPAPARQELSFHNHGTRVTVTDLFGAMPVRVKQRAADPSKTRAWETLKRKTVGLLLAWRIDVQLRIKDVSGALMLSLKGEAHAKIDEGRDIEKAVRRRAVPSLLTQAAYIDHIDWDSWVPLSASTPEFMIKGSISLEPAPTKTIQFISVGVRPLFDTEGHNELYDQVNRLFSNSRFGMEEDAQAKSDDDLRAAKSAEMLNKFGQYKGLRKGFDRWPMFYFRLTFKHTSDSVVFDFEKAEHRSMLSRVVDTLSVMVTRWLSTHDFKPRQRKPRTTEFTDTGHTLSSQAIEPDRGRKTKLANSIKSLERADDIPMSELETVEPTQHPKFRNFNEWSRIKSSNPHFYDDVWSKRIQTTQETRTRHTTEGSSLFKSQDIGPGSLSDSNAVPPAQGKVVEAPARGLYSHVGQEGRHAQMLEDTMSRWVDPTSQKAMLVNTRTGCIVPEEGIRAKRETSALRHLSLRKPTKSVMEGSWDNPVFKPAEKPITRVSDSPIALPETTITKGTLSSARVIAQVDRKFILIQLDRHARNSLVLVDQHAADERCQVERLFKELCTTISDPNPCVSNLGHKARVRSILLLKSIHFDISAQEARLLRDCAASFANWGVLYDIEVRSKPVNSTKSTQSVLIVRSLPPSILERCRTEPKVLLSMLRTEAWKSNGGSASHTITQSPDTEHSWLSHISSAPSGLLDMVNSRACRSAIMFNDYLSLEQCTELVRRLAKCALPFQCAHGRPSMVPLTDLPYQEPLQQDDLGFDGFPALQGGRSKSFTEAFKAWKRA